jgi:hypothetical protein
MGWSEKYKKSIDCNNPKGFSQKAHCAGRKKRKNEMVFEEITEDILNEKLITYGNRKPYGQVVFMAGGAGSGKGFAIKNFVDSASFKIRDVDEMKKQLQILNRLGKLDIRTILKKYGRNIKLKDLDLIRKIEKDGYRLQNLNLKNPDHVYALHILVKAMGIKDNTLEKLLLGKNNPETLPNILFDITAKDVTDITKVVPKLKEVGYKPENIHLTWVLTNYVTAMVNNRNRSRMVPEDILLKTHEGAANTVWGLITKALPKGMNGRVDVILNNPEHTVFYTDADGKTISGGVKGFLSLPVKKEKGGIFPEKVWKDKLFRWVKGNAPDSITANMEESVNEINEVKEPEVISQLRDIVKGKQNKKIKDPKSGKMMRVDLYSASAITKVYDAINKSNKDKFGKLSLPKMVNVAFSVIKKESVNEAKLNVRDLPNYIFDDPDDFEDWYDGGMKLNKKGTKLAPFSKSDERKLFTLVDDWIESRDDNRFGSGSSSDIDDQIKDIEKFLKQKGSVLRESVNEGKFKPSQVRSAISKVKKGLMRKWKQKGGYENFGQKELSQMRDKFDYNPYGSSDERQIAKMLDGFDNWAMNYDGNMREAYVVLYSPKKGVKPVTTAAYKDKKDAEKWAKDLGGITMIVKKKVKGIDEKMDLNDPMLVRLRAAQIKRNQQAADRLKKAKSDKEKEKAEKLAARNATKIKALKKKRADIMRDMEQEAEPEGGKIADRYGRMLNKIDNDIIKLGGNPMTEAKVSPQILQKLNLGLKKINRKFKGASLDGDTIDIELHSGHNRDSEIYQIYDLLKKLKLDKHRTSIFNEGFKSDAQRKAAFANGYEEKGKKKIKKEITIEERINLFVEKNVPTNPSKWAYYKAQAKKKFDVYPSAYANGWAAKKYKAAGGGWRKEK